jgi:hypothetical protein
LVAKKKYEVVGSTFLVGIVTRQKKNGNGQAVQNSYEIKWTSSKFQSSNHVHYITLDKVHEGIRHYQTMMKSRISNESWDVLCRPYDEITHTTDLWDDFEEVEESLVRFETQHSLPLDLVEVETIKSMEFIPDAFISAPSDLYCREDGGTDTELRAESKPLFEHSASSAFFALLPLSFWRTVVDNTNLYAAGSKQPLVTLEELMKFLGILFYMTLVDKGEHANYWGEQLDIVSLGESSPGLELVMTFKRFRFIRKNLSFRVSVSLEELRSDPAARIRPLINMLKLRSPTHVVLGRNVAVDETSVACRSKFGRHLIVYNSTKPTGKYHFKIYMCCCSTSWYATSMKLHCSSGIGDRLGGVVNESTIKSLELAMVKSKDVRKHVLEVTLPIHKSKRIVNTDNYYTSVQLLESLRVVGLYSRGTIRENSKFGHKSFMLSKTDKLQRGTTRQGVEIKHKIIGASWADGAVVNIISNADDSTISTVTRTIGRTKVEFPAPTCIGEYNKAMQGVDRIDQLRSRFSIADGHTFKKWHKKLAMAYIDIARCNAYIGRKLSGATMDQRDPHRQFMAELSSHLIHGEWQHALGDSGLLFSDPSVVPPSGTNSSPRMASPSKSVVQCSFENSKQVFPKSRPKRGCSVCRFEGRHPSEQTVYCYNHRTSLCTTVHSSQVFPYMCPFPDMTCWAKFHSFYHAAGLFNSNGNIRPSSHLFRAKKKYEAQLVQPQLGAIPEEREAVPPSFEGDVIVSQRDNGYDQSHQPEQVHELKYDSSLSEKSFKEYTMSDLDNFSVDTSIDFD